MKFGSYPRDAERNGTPARRALANAGNRLDVTREAPDGSITALDGALDPYFREVYLESESLPPLTRLVSELSSDAMDDWQELIRVGDPQTAADGPVEGDQRLELSPGAPASPGFEAEIANIATDKG